MDNTSKVMIKRSLPVWVVVMVSILLVSLLAACGAQSAQPTVSSLPKEISVQEVSAFRDQGAFILDVREPDEWVQFHIPGATLIPLGDLQNRLDEIPADKTIVVVCRSGNRSQSGRDILLNAGFINVTSMTGGVTEWQAQGLPIATGQ